MPAEERKLATVLFADLVGSTELAGDEDPERVRALLDRFYDSMAVEIEQAGGTVEKSVVRLLAAQSSPAPIPVVLPARRSERLLASVAHRGLQISALISVGLLLGLLAINTHTAWLAAVKLAFGVTMMGEGVLLATNWRDARKLAADAGGYATRRASGRARRKTRSRRSCHRLVANTAVPCAPGPTFARSS